MPYLSSTTPYYGGGQVPNPANVLYGTVAPNTADIHHPLGTLYVNTATKEIFSLTSVSGGVATWSPLGGGTDTFPITPYVVGPAGQAGYQTVQSAINAAHAAGGGAVYIQQGTYTENLTLYDQVNLVGVPAISQGANEGSRIIGVHTPPLTGQVLINGIFLQSSTSVFSSTAAGSSHIAVSNCESAVGSGYLFNLLNWTGIIEIYDHNPFPNNAPISINDGGVNNTGGAVIIVYNSGVGSGTNTMTISGPNSIFGQAVAVGCPVNLVTGANLTSVGSQYLGNVTLSNNSVIYSTNDSFITGSSPAITMSSSANCIFANGVIDSTNNPAISGAGAGALQLTDMCYLHNSNISGSLTVSSGQVKGAPFVTQFVVSKDGSTPYTTIQSALNDANSAGGGVVVIRPGTYTENLTLYNKTQVCGSVGFADTGDFVIIGVHTPPTTGGFVFRNVSLQSATHIFSSNASGSAHLLATDSIITVTNGYLWNLPNWTGILENYNLNSANGTSDGFVNNTGGATVLVFSAGVGAGTGNTASISGAIFTDGAEFGCPVNFVTGASLTLERASFSGSVTCSNNSMGYFRQCIIETGSTTALTMSSSAAIELSSVVIASSHNPAIAGAGAGTLSLGDITFTSNSSIAGTLTLAWSASKTGPFTATGAITASGGQVFAGGDSAGVASTISLTNTNSTTISSGTGTVKMSSTNNANNAAWLKIYIGTTAYWIPAWTNNAP